MKDVNLQNMNTKVPNLLRISTTMLLKYEHEESHDDRVFCYILIVGKLNYLEKSTTPVIVYTVHQYARFNNPMKSHTHTSNNILSEIREKNLRQWVDLEVKQRKLIRMCPMLR